MRVLVGMMVLLIVIVAGGTYLATRGGAENQAAGDTSTTAARAAVAENVSLGAPPLRAVLAKDSDIAVYPAPSVAAAPMTTLSKETRYDITRSLLAFDQVQDWLHVYLPTRPNGSTGWVKASDVTVSTPLDYQIKVSLADHRLTLLKDGQVQWDAPAATGTGDTPTPTGTFYFTDPLDLHDQPGTGYGVFAIGLSGHSNVLQSFAGGDGQIAVHGTDDSATIGQSVSHGCVRVDNDVVMRLSTLPLGTPVVIS
jgi:lipoprotein-anchoring transpeptidase ErfK/SrfK